MTNREDVGITENMTEINAAKEFVTIVATSIIEDSPNVTLANDELESISITSRVNLRRGRCLGLSGMSSSSSAKKGDLEGGTQEFFISW